MIVIQREREREREERERETERERQKERQRERGNQAYLGAYRLHGNLFKIGTAQCFLYKHPQFVPPTTKQTTSHQNTRRPLAKWSSMRVVNNRQVLNLFTELPNIVYISFRSILLF